jgi:phosphoribosylanthranilate isomerase
MTLIKICGVKTAEEGYQAAKGGADFVGIVMHRPSKRYVAVDDVQQIVKAVVKGGAIPVAVFYKETGEEVLRAIEKTSITMVQTYADITLPTRYTLIVANPCERGMNRSKELFLFDGSHPGSGELLKPELLPNPLPGNFFIAGGIGIDNVQDILQAYRPTGIDVSSGVELQGKKDIKMINQLIQKVRDYDKTIR